MDADEALAALPEVYADALRLRAQGLAGAEIAMRVGVPGSAVDALLRLGAAKLARLVATPADIDPASPGHGPSTPATTELRQGAPHQDGGGQQENGEQGDGVADAADGARGTVTQHPDQRRTEQGAG